MKAIKPIFIIFMLFAALTMSAQTHNITRGGTKPNKQQTTTTKKATTPSSKKAVSATQKRSTANQNQQAARRAEEERRAKSSLCPDGNHPHMIDLGLPSGTKWACCNVGASKPESYGSYYAWGETVTKSTYNETTYKYYQNGEYVNLGSDIAGTSYDVAHVIWRGSWVMPSKVQQDELRNNCTYEWTIMNGVKGGKFTSKKNGRSIFLPAAGYRWDDDLYHAGSSDYVWSSAQNPLRSFDAFSLYFNSGSVYCGNYFRYYGYSVRPVSR